MATDVAPAAGGSNGSAEPMPRDRVPVLATALAGSLLVNLTGQFVPFNIADIAGAIGASADESSWLVTVYSMGLFGGIVFASPVVATFGLRRYMTASALLFALAALAAGAAPPLPWMIGLRGLQGFVAGGFGPMAFVATFMTTAGPRLPFGLSLLALILLVPASLGPALSGYVEDRLGWEALFYMQGAVGSGLAVLASLFMPPAPIAWPGLRRDWTTAFLIPQFLIIVQNYRPLEVGQLYLWAAVPQLLVYPIVWQLLRRIDGRLIIACGLLLFGFGAVLAATSTSGVAAGEFRLAMALAGAGRCCSSCRTSSRAA